MFPQSNELATAEIHEMALADNYIYELMRVFASASRAMAMYDCSTCLEELNRIPEVHQRSAWVMVMAGRAHYEMVDYIKVTNTIHLSVYIITLFSMAHYCM